MFVGKPLALLSATAFYCSSMAFPLFSVALSWDSAAACDCELAALA